MQDINLRSGDFSALYQGKDNDGNSIYDLEIRTDAESTLVRRSLETPYAYLKLWTDNPYSLIDNTFGNRIYELLSDPFSNAFMSGFSSYINQALSHVTDYIDIIDLTIEAINLNSIEVRLTYKSKESNQIESTVVNI